MTSQLKYIIGIGILIIGLSIFSKPIFKSFANTDTVLNKIGCRLFEFNTISVKTSSNVDLNKVQIKKGDRIVFKDARQQNRIGQEYGDCILDIYYENLLIAEVGHFKRNNWYSNKYEIKISKKENNFIVNYQISGPDAKTDNFQKRYIYNDIKKLIRIDFLNEQGEIYNTKRKSVIKD